MPPARKCTRTFWETGIGGVKTYRTLGGGGELAPKVAPRRLGALTPKLAIFERISVEGALESSKVSPPPSNFRRFDPPLSQIPTFFMCCIDFTQTYTYNCSLQVCRHLVLPCCKVSCAGIPHLHSHFRILFRNCLHLQYVGGGGGCSDRFSTSKACHIKPLGRM